MSYTHKFTILVMLFLFQVVYLNAVYSATYTVTQSGFVFSPKDITISEGDTVKWQWTNGTHTVTSGTGGLDPDAGKLFDAIISTSNPTFEYVFTSPGVVPYFCRPHEAFGMKGTVTVLSRIPVDTPQFIFLLMMSVTVLLFFYALNHGITAIHS